MLSAGVGPFAPWAGARGVVLAVSGGPDSIALMRLAADWRAAGAPRLSVACVDHRLRPESTREAEAVVAQAARLGFDAVTLVWAEAQPGPALQERARAARYRLLSAEARRRGADVVMTAHHADDQAETVLMRLSRGSGVAGLAGMAASTRRGGVEIARPLLGLRKAALVELCRREGLAFVDDTMNADPRFARARLRRVLPGLGLDVDALLRLAARAARADAALERAAADVLPVQARAVGCALDLAALAAAPAELRLRALRRAIETAAPPLPDAAPLRLERLEALEARFAAALAAGAPFAATLGGAALRRTAATLDIRPAPPRRASPHSPRVAATLGKAGLRT
ncbi:MAG: tRNA lysidine(34) synthetase TilS [Methylobacteriaceae bacterium]|nr:tRNA lysidine(34) synthetase TilS [Methylobacteriaceae bacterium]